MHGKTFPFFNYLAPVFTKDRVYGNARDDIDDDATQYEHDASITLEDDVGFSQVPIDGFFMPTQEPTKAPLPMASDGRTSRTSARPKRKSIARDPTMEQIYENF